jgi:deazaflavin-dependent oxidoreductase (nitroreductase family)
MTDDRCVLSTARAVKNRGVTARRPGPRLVRLLAAPAALYDVHAGWLLRRRFLRLTHVGRITGREYQTVLEVIGQNPVAREVMVMAGLGRRAQWYLNVRGGGGAEVAIGSQRFVPAVRELEPEEAAAVLAEYEARHRWVRPVVRRVLSRLVGWTYDGTAASRARLVAELPVVALRPRK